MNYKHSLLIILAAALLLRIACIAGTHTYEPAAYQTIRQAEHIKDTGLPLIKDHLQERTLKPLPVFPYILAFSTLIMPDNLAYLLVPNILAVLLHLAVYMLTVELTNERRLALLAAAASIFIPAYLSATVLTVSSLSLALPLFLFTVTLYLKLRKSPEKRLLLLGTFILLCFTSPLAILFLPFLVLNLTLSAIKRVKGETAQQEFGIFAICFLLWFNLLLYKGFVQQAGLESLRTASMNLPAMAAAIGLVPFSLAFYTAYKEANTEHIGILSALSATISVGIFLAIGYIPQVSGLAILASLIICLAAAGVQRLATYSRHLKKHSITYVVSIIACMLFLATNVLPSITAGIGARQGTVPDELVATVTWLKDNSAKDSLVLTKPEWGSLVETIAHRPVYVDTDTITSPAYVERASLAERALAGDDQVLIDNHIEYIIREDLTENNCLNIVQGEHIQLAKVLCS